MNAPRTLAATLCAVLAASVCPGCQALWPVLEKMFPEDPVPPRFKLPSGKTVLVFADDKVYPVGYSPVLRIVNEKTSELLRQHKVARATVDYDRLIDLRRTEPDYGNLAVASVGRKLQADLVIYVLVDQFNLKDTPEDTLWKGTFSAKVRVVDVWKGKLWPDESAGFPVKVTEPETHNTSESYGEELAKQLGERLSQEIAGLFYQRYVERSRPPESDGLPEN